MLFGLVDAVWFFNKEDMYVCDILYINIDVACFNFFRTNLKVHAARTVVREEILAQFTIWIHGPLTLYIPFVTIKSNEHIQFIAL